MINKLMYMFGCFVLMGILLTGIVLSQTLYTVKDVVINNKQAKEINFPFITIDYNLSELAKSQKTDPTELLKITKKNVYGEAEVKLKELKSVEKTRITGYRDINCKITKNGSICDQVPIYETYYQDELIEINPYNFVITKDTKIYEVFEGCNKIEKMGNSWGCSTWTDVKILNYDIEGASWFNLSWWYRQPLSINSSVGDIPGIPILVNGTSYIDTLSLINDNKLDPNCYCMWFYDQNNNSMAWNFSNIDNGVYGCNTANSEVWLNASPNQTAYMYYNGSCGASVGSWTNPFNDLNHTWTVSESSGKWLNDSTGSNGITLTANSWESGIFGYGIKSIGQTNSYWVSENINKRSYTTLNIWLYSHDQGRSSSGAFLNGRPILGVTNGQWSINWISNGTIHALFMSGGTWSARFMTNQTLPTDRWNMITITYDGTTIKMFSDSVLVGQDTFAGYLWCSNCPLSNCGFSGGSCYWYANATYDSMMIWNRSLSYPEIKRLYQYGLSSFGSEESVAPVPPAPVIPVYDGFAGLYGNNLLLRVNCLWDNDTICDYGVMVGYNVTTTRALCCMLLGVS